MRPTTASKPIINRQRRRACRHACRLRPARERRCMPNAIAAAAVRCGGPDGIDASRTDDAHGRGTDGSRAPLRGANMIPHLPCTQGVLHAGLLVHFP